MHKIQGPAHFLADGVSWLPKVECDNTTPFGSIPNLRTSTAHSATISAISSAPVTPHIVIGCYRVPECSTSAFMEVGLLIPSASPISLTICFKCAP